MMSKLVLIVDDSKTICKIIEVHLRRSDYEVNCCFSGELALQWLRSPEVRIPDLICVDLCLPKMDGYSLIQHLRAQPILSRIPLVIITRRNGYIDKLKGRLVGASAYLVKPLTMDHLLSVVETYLGRKVKKV